MDPLLANVLWALLLGVAVGAVLVELVAALRGRRRQVEAAERHALLAEFRYALSGDLDRAVEEITGRVAADGPGGVETWFALGSLLRRKGDHLRAIRIHEDLVGNGRLHPSVRRAAAYELALDFRRAGMHGRAVETLEALLAADPDHREARRELREIAEEEGDWDRAIAAQERLAASAPEEAGILAHLHAARARALLAAGRIDEAEAAVARAIAAAPSSADALAARAEVRAAQGDCQGAEEALAAALDRCPDLAAVASLDAVGDPVAFLEARLARHPDHPWLRLALARRLRAAGRPDRAVAVLRALLRERPELAEVRHELAGSLLAGGHDHDDAELREELRALLDGLEAAARPFACERCRMELSAFAFRCARCFGWDTVRAAPAAAGGGDAIESHRRTGS